MPHGFDMYRVFISAPGDLERDREACHAAISEVNKTTAMPVKVLLVSVGLQNDDQISGFRSVVSDNVRWSTFFIQVFEDDWGPRNLFQKLFYLATECRDDASLPMRDVVVCLKAAPHITDAQTLAFRKELEERQDVRVFHYSGVDELRAQLTAVCNGWARSVIDSPAAAAGAGA